jgi:hypothetical protein
MPYGEIERAVHAALREEGIYIDVSGFPAKASLRPHTIWHLEVWVTWKMIDVHKPGPIFKRLTVNVGDPQAIEKVAAYIKTELDVHK